MAGTTGLEPASRETSDENRGEKKTPVSVVALTSWRLLRIAADSNRPTKEERYRKAAAQRRVSRPRYRPTRDGRASGP